MPCFTPLQGYRSRETTTNGKRQIVFNPSAGYKDLPVTVPCGQCSGCRLERSRQWAIRCFHEASLYENNCFITLTYSDLFLPADRSVSVREFQLFMKRLRKRYGPGIRFFACGEYGEKLSRPHYHACLFNHDFKDRELFSERNGQKYYTSEELSEIWADPVSGYPLGHSLIGEVTFQSAAYVARYIMKKINGEMASDHYQYVDDLSGEILSLKPEFVTMSRRPGIGKGWLEAYEYEPYQHDQVIINGRPVRPPKYYDRQYEIEQPPAWRAIRAKRVRDAKKHADNNTPERLAVRQKVHDAKLQKLPRTYEDNTP